MNRLFLNAFTALVALQSLFNSNAHAIAHAPSETQSLSPAQAIGYIGSSVARYGDCYFLFPQLTEGGESLNGPLTMVFGKRSANQSLQAVMRPSDVFILKKYAANSIWTLESQIDGQVLFIEGALDANGGVISGFSRVQRLGNISCAIAPTGIAQSR